MSKVGKRALFSLLLVLGALSGGARQSPQKPPAVGRAEVLVLGTFHMANRNHDLYNLHADDVLSPQRQSELAQLREVLKRFHPTKIAVEAPLPDSPKTPASGPMKLYDDYLAGRHELSRDEVEQVGFRLAKELGHKVVYSANADYDFPYQHLLDYAKANGQSSQLEQIMGVFGDKTKALGVYLSSHTILDTLLWLNTDQQCDLETGLYYRLAHLGRPGDFAGADLLSDWFRRNARIFTNVARLVESPHDRILVIFGYGHLAWLRRDVASDPTLRLRKLSEFVGVHRSDTKH